MVFEQNGTKIIEFWHNGDEFLVLFQLDALEEVRKDAVVALQQLQVYCGIEWQVQWQLSFLHSEDVVNESVYIFLLD